MSEHAIPEWKVEYPSSRSDISLPRHSWTFYDETEAGEFCRGLGDLAGVVTFRRTVTVGDWQPVSVPGGEEPNQ